MVDYAANINFLILLFIKNGMKKYFLNYQLTGINVNTVKINENKAKHDLWPHTKKILKKEF